jgi:hypothetical protein
MFYKRYEHNAIGLSGLAMRGYSENSTSYDMTSVWVVRDIHSQRFWRTNYDKTSATLVHTERFRCDWRMRLSRKGGASDLLGFPWASAVPVVDSYFTAGYWFETCRIWGCRDGKRERSSERVSKIAPHFFLPYSSHTIYIYIQTYKNGWKIVTYHHALASDPEYMKIETLSSNLGISLTLSLFL